MTSSNILETDFFQPNYSNLATTELIKEDLAKEIVTTNFDGLAQKSGCPQNKVIELR